MRLLVTGGTGLLGRALIARAHAIGCDVTATRLTQAPCDARAAWRTLDARDRGAVFACVRALRPDAVIHTAYVQQGPSLRAVTADGARFVAEAAREVGARLVHLSTDVVFDGTSDRPYTEADAHSPAHEYGRAKADAERMVLDAHPEAAVVRTSLLYALSPEDRQAKLALDLAAGRAKGALFTDEIRNPSQVDELSDALLELCGRRFAGPIHVVGAEAVSRHAFGAMLVGYHGGDPTRLPGARSADQPVARPKNCALDSALARSVLRSVPRGVTEVLRRT